VPAPMGSINPDWPLAPFASGLQALKETSRLTYRDMARATHYGRESLSAAARGRELPTWEVTEAYVRVCKGSVHEWRGRWEAARKQLHAHQLRDGR
jgi:Helix-turn-helix domain